MGARHHAVVFLRNFNEAVADWWRFVFNEVKSGAGRRLMLNSLMSRNPAPSPKENRLEIMGL